MYRACRIIFPQDLFNFSFFNFHPACSEQSRTGLQVMVILPFMSVHATIWEKSFAKRMQRNKKEQRVTKKSYVFMYILPHFPVHTDSIGRGFHKGGTVMSSRFSVLLVQFAPGLFPAYCGQGTGPPHNSARKGNKKYYSNILLKSSTDTVLCSSVT